MQSKWMFRRRFQTWDIRESSIAKTSQFITRRAKRQKSNKSGADRWACCLLVCFRRKKGREQNALLCGQQAARNFSQGNKRIAPVFGIKNYCFAKKIKHDKLISGFECNSVCLRKGRPAMNDTAKISLPKKYYFLLVTIFILISWFLWIVKREINFSDWQISLLVFVISYSFLSYYFLSRLNIISFLKTNIFFILFVFIFMFIALYIIIRQRISCLPYDQTTECYATWQLCQRLDCSWLYSLIIIFVSFCCFALLFFKSKLKNIAVENGIKPQFLFFNLVFAMFLSAFIHIVFEN